MGKIRLASFFDSCWSFHSWFPRHVLIGSVPANSWAGFGVACRSTTSPVHVPITGTRITQQRFEGHAPLVAAHENTWIECGLAATVSRRRRSSGTTVGQPTSAKDRASSSVRRGSRSLTPRCSGLRPARVYS